MPFGFLWRQMETTLCALGAAASRHPLGEISDLHTAEL
jgi:hypothetical protein